MKKIVKTILLIVIGVFLGIYITNNFDSFDKKSASSSNKKPIYWVAPMDPNYKRDKPGKSPMGMDLVPVYKENTQEGISVSSQVQQNIGVQTELAEYRKLNIEVSGLGEISSNENLVKHIHSYEDGWIEKLMITELGQSVSKNQIIGYLYSPKLNEAQQELVYAIKTKKYVEQTQAKLSALGFSKEQINRIKSTKKVEKLIEIRSPLKGFITELKAEEGMFITPQDNLMTITNLESVWLNIEILPFDLKYISLGNRVQATDVYTNQKFDGNISFISPYSDPIKRTTIARVVLNNPNYVLKPNFLLDVKIISQKKMKSLTIPLSSVIRLENVNYVFVKEKNQFIPKEVLLGDENSKYIEVLKGLNKKDKVVTSSLFLIDSASDLTASLKRLSSEKKVEQKQVTETVGVIKNINKEKGFLVIRHEAIKSLNWPPMTMRFYLSNISKLEQFKKGDDINFSFYKTSNGYTIDKITLLK
ncbi:efflux RND transporter periplasmic adaptor subunit [Paraphotobacterium marinum]|nr:efflux RND transporter periplasmic adaptor subunit [Paraphotobacterium marinum]